jgi:stage V sporulation protein G
MEITDIKIRRIVAEGRLRAVVSITLDHMFAVHDIKIVQGNERIFLAMPSRKDENGTFRDVFHPIHPEARKLLEERILTAYQQYLVLLQEREAAEQNAQDNAEPVQDNAELAQETETTEA